MNVATPSVLLSVVSPVYWANDAVAELVRRLVAAIEPIGLDFEIILVDDRSPDESWARIQEQMAREPRVLPAEGHVREILAATKNSSGARR